MEKTLHIFSAATLIILAFVSYAFANQNLYCNTVAEARLIKTGGAEQVDAPADYVALATGDELQIDFYTTPEKRFYFYNASSGHADDGINYIAPSYISAGVSYSGSGRWVFLSHLPMTYSDVGAAAASHTHTGVYAPYLSNPAANVLYGWDNTDAAFHFINLGTNLSYDHNSHTLSATGGNGSGNVVGPATNHAGWIPAWGSANSNTLIDGYQVNTTVGNPGSDSALVTEEAIRELFSANGLFDPANPGIIGGTTPAAGHFTDLTANTFALNKQSGVAGDFWLYEANSTDTNTAGFRGAPNQTYSYRMGFSNTRPTSANAILALGTYTSGSGTPADPYICPGDWLYAGSSAGNIPVLDGSGHLTENTTGTSASTPKVTFYLTKELTVAAPANSAQDWFIASIPFAATVVDVKFWNVGGTNTVMNAYIWSAPGGSSTSITTDKTVTGVTDVSSFSNSAITSGYWLGLHITSSSGSPTQCGVVIEYTMN